MPLTEQFVRGGEKAVASYNYTDISEGTGVTVYYGYAHREETTSTYGLIIQPVYSEFNTQNAAEERQGATTGTIDVVSFTKELDMDFDLKFNMPQKIKGKVRTYFTFGGVTAVGGSNEVQMYVIVRVKNGETEIASSQSRTIETNADTEYLKTASIEVDIPTIAHFKGGETLRITAEVWGKKINTGTRVICFYHNPLDTNKGVGDPTSIFQVHVPFVLDL